MFNKIEIISHHSLTIKNSLDGEKGKENTLIDYTNERISKLDISFDDRKNSSDSTSQTENISDSSFSLYTNNMQNFTQKDINKNENKRKIKYFDGFEKYFYKLMPEKFNDYKKSKNFISKNIPTEERENNIEIINDKIKEGDNVNNNKFNTTKIGINNEYKYVYYPIYGSIFYPSYNTFYYNYSFINLPTQDFNNVDEEDKIEENEINQKVSNDIEDKKEEEETDIYIIAKKEKKIKKYYKDKNPKINYNNKKCKEFNNYLKIFNKNNNLFMGNYFSKKINYNISYKLNEFNIKQRKSYINNSKYNKFNNYNNKRQFHKNIYY